LSSGIAPDLHPRSPDLRYVPRNVPPENEGVRAKLKSSDKQTDWVTESLSLTRLRHLRWTTRAAPLRIAPECLVEEPAGVEQGLDLLAFDSLSDRAVGRSNANESGCFDKARPDRFFGLSSHSKCGFAARVRSYPGRPLEGRFAIGETMPASRSRSWSFRFSRAACRRRRLAAIICARSLSARSSALSRRQSASC
jgi:hypothetical protein